MELLLLWLVFAIVVGYAASTKGRSGVGWFLLAVLISPLIAVIFLLLAGNAAWKTAAAHGAAIESRQNHAATLSSLADLRDRGVLTEEEFQAKKTDLLAKV
jgi:hypothetical protein